MKIKAAFVIALLGLAVAPVLQAQAYGWGGGHWIHDRHEGRLGWWWVVGPAWTFYPRPYPVYVTPAPQTVIVEQPAAQPQVVMAAPPAPQAMTAPPAPAQVIPVMYYCRATETYYPETMTCPGGWSTSVAGTPPSPTK